MWYLALQKEKKGAHDTHWDTVRQSVARTTVQLSGG